jgi:outer membrane protein
MRILIATAALILVSAFTSTAQKFAYVDTEYILEHIPEYVRAQEKLDAISEEWQKEIERRRNEVEDLYKEFQASQVLMTEEMKRKREQEIIAKEKAIKAYQKQKFGYQGELFKKRKELVKPIQDKVYDAIEALAKARGYEVIFDKSGGLIMLYADAKHDKSDDVIKRLGYTPGQKAE